MTPAFKGKQCRGNGFEFEAFITEGSVCDCGPPSFYVALLIDTNDHLSGDSDRPNLFEITYTDTVHRCHFYEFFSLVI